MPNHSRADRAISLAVQVLISPLIEMSRWAARLGGKVAGLFRAREGRS